MSFSGERVTLPRDESGGDSEPDAGRLKIDLSLLSDKDWPYVEESNLTVAENETRAVLVWGKTWCVCRDVKVSVWSFLVTLTSAKRYLCKAPRGPRTASSLQSRISSPEAGTTKTLSSGHAISRAAGCLGRPAWNVGNEDLLCGWRTLFGSRRRLDTNNGLLWKPCAGSAIGEVELPERNSGAN